MRKIGINLVGDIFPANLPHKVGTGIASEFYNHKGKPWLPLIKNILTNADISLANLESPLLPINKLPHEKYFAGSEDFTDFLKALGISVVSIANNHILEQGSEGFDNTLLCLNNAEIKYIGEVQGNSSKIFCKVIDHHKVGFASFSSVPDKNNINYYAQLNLYSIHSSLDNMEREGCTTKIISLHWGDEYINIPAFWQVELAHKIIDYGADIIAGHHPHVIQPMEKYKDGIIFYSLGNFIFDMTHQKSTRYGILVKVIIDELYNKNIKIIPIYINNIYAPEQVFQNDNVINKMEKSLNEMKTLLSLGKDKYEESYIKKLKYIKILNRFFYMKLELIKNLPNLSPKSREYLIKRIKQISRSIIE
jgi:poly-gamma-glutamate synthesis protein (capsule biosynthesis protein)